MTRGLKVWAIGAGVASLALIGGGYAVGVQPALAAAAADDAATANEAGQALTLQTSLVGLSKDAAKQPEFEVEQAKLLKAVPSTLKPNTFVRRVSELAALDGVQVGAVTPETGQAYKAPTVQGATSGTPAAPTQLAAIDPVITANDFTVIPVTVTVTGTPVSLLSFTHDLQDDERLFLVSGYSATVEPDDVTKSTATLTGYLYALKR